MKLVPWFLRPLALVQSKCHVRCLTPWNYCVCKDPKIFLTNGKRCLVYPQLFCPSWVQDRRQACSEEGFRCLQAQPWPASTDGDPKKEIPRWTRTVNQLAELWEMTTNCFNTVSCYLAIDNQNFIADRLGERYIWVFTKPPWVWSNESTKLVHPHNFHPLSKWSILKFSVLANVIYIYIYIILFLKWPTTQYDLDLCSCHINFLEISPSWKAFDTEHWYSVGCRICSIPCLNLLLAS